MKYITLALLATLGALHYQIWFQPNPDGTTGLRRQYEQMQHSAQTVKQQNDIKREANRALRAEVEDLQHGYEAVAEIARSEMGYIKKGETFYRLPEE